MTTYTYYKDEKTDNERIKQFEHGLLRFEYLQERGEYTLLKYGLLHPIQYFSDKEMFESAKAAALAQSAERETEVAAGAEEVGA